MIVPAAFLNTKEKQISSIDNKMLAEWPGLDWTLKTNTKVEDYLNDRIGFREQAIEAYTELNDRLFHVMVHPLFMYGKEGPLLIFLPLRMDILRKRILSSFIFSVPTRNRYIPNIFRIRSMSMRSARE